MSSIERFGQAETEVEPTRRRWAYWALCELVGWVACLTGVGLMLFDGRPSGPIIAFSGFVASLVCRFFRRT